jgi:predicted nucleotidyltransferase
MKESFGLNKSSIAQIHAVLRKFNAIEKAVIYGSRAKGNFRAGSDIDLTLFGKVSTGMLADIIDALDDSDLAYTFDVSVFDELKNDELKEHIERVGREFYRREGEAGEGIMKHLVCEYSKVNQPGSVIEKGKVPSAEDFRQIPIDKNEGEL